ncbi:MAG: trypsin-like peptidase domain-containing protein [Alphaproteobacteria bacterium]|nr:trypsin-like peptidase domain-containing protein [Alphaproteobacteria bacterium]
MRNIFIGCVALVLAGCTANQEVDLESRDFMVQQNAVPASTGVESTEHMARLLKLSGPTYVTLVVSDGEKQTTSSRPSENRAIPVTSGSGFLVDSGGYVMTAAHVAVRKGNTVSARAANGRIYSGQVVDILPSNDMALIKLRGFSGKATSPAPSQCVPRGSMVYSLGKPHAEGDTARVGRLESMHYGRAVSYGKYGYPDAMVLKMSTHRGESGGPVFNDSGELVGMVVSTLTDANGNLINLAHAIPSASLAQFLCRNISCGGAWASLAQTTTDSCPAI